MEGSYTDRYENFIKKHERSHFLQSPMWAKVKNNWKNELITVERDGEIKGAMSLLIRKLPLLGCTLIYSPRAPVCDLHDPVTLGELLIKCREIARKNKAYALKLDPDVCCNDELFTRIMTGLGFKNKRDSKNFEDIQPRFVFRLDISGKTEEQLLNSFHQKTRYNIRLALKKGVEVRQGGKEDLEAFHKLMLETGLRDEFVPRSLSYFERMYECLGENIALFLARHHTELIAATIAVTYGGKCWYLYGASSNKHRNLMPNYLLQWEMIKWARLKDCKIYDFRGVSGDMDENSPLFGLYKFKKGFNGELTEFIGEMDYVFKPLVYLAVENAQKTLRKLRRKLYLARNNAHDSNQNGYKERNEEADNREGQA